MRSLPRLVVLTAFASFTAVAAAGCNNASTAVDMATADMAMPHANVDFGPEPLDGGPNVAATTAVIVTSTPGTGGQAGTGSLDTVSLSTHAPTTKIDETLSGNTLARAYGGKVLVVDRANGTLRVYDPTAGYKNPIEVATGDAAAPAATSNPEDALLVPTTSKVYVALYGNDAAHAVAIIDIGKASPTVTGYVAIPVAKSPLPRVQNLYFCGPYVYALVQDLDANYAVTGPGRIVVIDPKTDAVAADTPVITLMGSNPGTGQDGIAPLDPKACDQVLVADTGDFSKQTMAGDGVELVDLTRRVSKGFVVTDAMLAMARPGSVSSASPDLAYVVVNTADFKMKVVAIDPLGMKVLGDVTGEANLIGFANVSPDGQLFLGVNTGSAALAAGLYIAPADGKAVSGAPIALDQGPYGVTFF